MYALLFLDNTFLDLLILLACSLLLVILVIILVIFAIKTDRHRRKK